MDWLSTKDFVIFDLETATLLEDGPARICEIGAIGTRDGKALGQFQSLVNPEGPISLEAFNIHKISDSMVKDSPLFNEIGEKFLAFAGDGILVAHNTAFDVPVINREFRRVGLPRWSRPSIDTVRLSRKAFQGLPSYSLDGLARFFEIEFTERHRSIGDCEVTLHVFWKCVERLIATDKVKSLADLLAIGRNRNAEHAA